MIEQDRLKTVLTKISYIQAAVLGILGATSYLLDQMSFSSAFLIVGIASYLYTQLLRFSINYAFLTLFGFPIRLLLIAPPVAILVHKFKSNLLALFIGFAISLIVYIFVIWLDSRNQN